MPKVGGWNCKTAGERAGLQLVARIASTMAEQGRVRVSDALVDQLREECRGDQELAPLGVKRRGRLGGDDLVEGATLLLQLRDVRAVGDEYVAKGCQLPCYSPSSRGRA